MPCSLNNYFTKFPILENILIQIPMFTIHKNCLELFNKYWGCK